MNLLRRSAVCTVGILTMGGLTIGLPVLHSRQLSPASAPAVAAASVPFYPRLWRSAGIRGTVRLLVSTDGRLVTRIRAVEGGALFETEAAQNVRTWVFREHRPTTFEVEFRYVLEGDSECEETSPKMILLRLPHAVELHASPLKTCEDLTKRR